MVSVLLTFSNPFPVYFIIAFFIKIEITMAIYKLEKLYIFIYILICKYINVYIIEEILSEQRKVARVRK